MSRNKEPQTGAGRTISDVCPGKRPARWLSLFLLTGFSVTACLIAPNHAHSQATANDGQPITLVISSAPGAGNDTYSRLAARHLGRFLPGNPAILPKNMPGAAGVVQANWLYNVAPRDGSVIGMMQSGPAFNKILGYPNIQYDPRKFHWLLSLGKLVSLAAVRHDTPLHSAQDLFDKKSIFGGESGDSVILPNLLNNLLGAKIQVVKGYGGVPNTIFAMQRGEIEGLSTYWDTLKSTQGDLLRDKKIRVLMQISLEKHPDLPHVPLVMDFVRDDETRQIWELILARQAIGRPLVAPPETPTAKVNELKDALTKMTADQQFLAEASKMNIEISVTPGERLAQLVEQAYKTPPGVIEKTIVALKRAEGQ